MPDRAWLRPPRLRTTLEGDEERHATWFELFFDLVFVAAVAQLAEGLANDLSASVFLRFAGLFVVIAWAWMGYAFYANRFDTDDIVYRIAKAGAMMAVASLAVTEPDVLEGTGGSAAFAISYVIVRALLLALYVRARRHTTGAAKRVAEVYLMGFSVGASLWLISIFVPTPARYYLWAAGMAVDICMPPIGWSALRAAPINPSHITERFGLFFIIVLGESVIADVTGTSNATFGVETSVVASLCFLTAICLWWIYFDLADTSVVGRGMLGLVFMYGHFVLLAGVTMLGAGAEQAIIHATGESLAAGIRWAISLGVAAFLLSLALFHVAAEWTTMRDRELAGRVVFALAALALAAIGGGLEPIVFVGLITACLTAQLVLEVLTSPAGAASVWQPSIAPMPESGSVVSTD
jgi:low temperature requirement protein LtrA